jgi:hypothetical protein
MMMTMLNDECGAICVTNDWLWKAKYWKKICPGAALSTTIPTRLDPGRSLSNAGGKPATIGLSHGTAGTHICTGTFSN